MKIGLDGQNLLIDKLAGPEVYTLNVVKSLAAIDKENDFIVYFDRIPDDNFWKELTNGNNKFSYKVLRSWLSWTQIALLIQLFLDKPDVFFNAKHTIPFIHPTKTKIISMIHGFEYRVNNQYFNNPLKHIIHPIILWWVIKFSSKVVVPSLHVKSIIDNLKWPFINREKVIVIPEGMSELFYKRPSSEVEEMRLKYKIKNNPYLIFVSTIQPRKNIPKMVNAFSKVVKKYDKYKDVKLLISGKLGWLYQESLAAPGKYGVAENMRFLGRTPDVDLPKLLSGAKAYINCSLEEGFGLPLLEAMACETPALVSDIQAFKEIGQDCPIYVDPNKVECIEQGILEILNSDMAERVKNAKILSKEYSWVNTVKQIKSLF